LAVALPLIVSVLGLYRPLSWNCAFRNHPRERTGHSLYETEIYHGAAPPSWHKASAPDRGRSRRLTKLAARHK